VSVGVVKDMSSNGTFVNEAIIGRNQRRDLVDFDEISLTKDIRFIFRYPKSRTVSRFQQDYTVLNMIGKGHFAEVSLCVERSTGLQYAVKIFRLAGGRSTKEGLSQEISILMAVNHPNIVCLKDVYYEDKSLNMILEFAKEGELFNLIVKRQKLSEAETRKIFKQLFDGIKYLVGRIPPRGNHLMAKIFLARSEYRPSRHKTGKYSPH
jgi:serine/threonine-protein kinase CHEK2